MIFHIVKRGEWIGAVGGEFYKPEGFAAEGFIHCSTLAQVVDTANRFYWGQHELVVLCIDEARLRCELKYEAPATLRRASQAGGEVAGALFPHLYGELNVDAVVRVVELPCESDGSFRLPEGLRDEAASNARS